ncbi:MAG: hypothetical protein L0H70_09225, partial [Xanthomonadales bacterium]|nr:hypothetical protein [Xanthomonadales bacterium]
MSSSWRRYWRRLRFALGALLAGVLIATAAAMALGQLLLPLLHEHPQEVAQLLSWRLHQPVSVGAVDGEWQSSGPLLSAQNLHIGQGEHALRLPRAQLKVDFGAWLKPDRRWLELRVTGLQADIRRDAAGQWQLTGLSSASQQTNAAALTDLPVGLLLRDVTLNIDDSKSQDHWRLQASLLRAITQGDSLRVAAHLTRKPGASPLTVVLHVDSQQHTARMYVAGDDIDLTRWTKGLAWSGVRLEGGRATRLRLWLGWHDGRLSDIDSIFALKDLRAASSSQQAVPLAPLNARLQAHREGKDWHATYAERPLVDDKPSARARLHWQAHADGSSSVDVDASRFDLAKMAPWLRLWPQLPSKLAAWLQAAKVHGKIDQAHVTWVDANQFDVQAQLKDVGFDAVGMLPSVDALRGELRADADALSLSLPPQALTIDEPKVFRQPFVL